MAVYHGLRPWMSPVNSIKLWFPRIQKLSHFCIKIADFRVEPGLLRGRLLKSQGEIHAVNLSVNFGFEHFTVARITAAVGGS